MNMKVQNGFRTQLADFPFQAANQYTTFRIQAAIGWTEKKWRVKKKQKKIELKKKKTKRILKNPEFRGKKKENKKRM